MLRKILYIPILLIALSVNAQQSTNFSGVVGFNDDGFGNYTSTTTGWNQNMLTSANFIAPNTDGSVSYTIASTSDKFAIGLSVATTSLKTKDITYRMLGGKKLSVWENNKLKGNYGNLAIGDIIQISREGSQVLFRKNGNIILSLNTDPSLTLYVKVQTQTSGMVIPSNAVTGDYYEEMELDFVVTHASCDNGSNGAIDLSVTKGVAPYTYLWNNGVTTEDLNGLSSGIYTITITDAINQQKSETITIQNELVWETPSGSNSISENRLLGGENGNITYIVNEEGVAKSFGLEDINNNHTGTEVEYSIKLLANGTINIFFEGTQLLGSYGNYVVGDELKIEVLNGEMLFKKNGVVMETQTINTVISYVARYIKHDAVATFNNISVDFCTLPLEVIYTTTEVTQNQLGSITLTPQFGAPPYSFFWNDGIQDQNRNELEAGIYNVVVKDTLLDSVALQIIVGTQIEWEQLASGLTFNNGILEKTAPNGWEDGSGTLLNRFIGDGEVMVEIVEENKEFVFGLRKESEESVPQNIVYGLYVDQNNNLFTYNSVSGLVQYGTVEIGDLLSIQKVGSELIYKLNGANLNQITIEESSYKIDFHLNTTMKIKPIIIGLPFWPVVTAVITHNTCYTTNSGAIDVTVQGGVPPYIFTWSNSAATEDINGLTNAVYNLTVTDSWFFPHSVPKSYEVGNSIDWTNLVNSSVNGNSLTKTGTNGYDGSGGQSSNVLLNASTNTEWAEFTVNELQDEETFGLDDDDGTHDPLTIAYGIKLFRLLPFAIRRVTVVENGINKGPFWGMGNYAKNDIFRIQKAGSTITYLKNGNVFYTSSTPSNTDLIVDASLDKTNSTILNAATSAICPPFNSYVSEVKLKRSLDGGVYTVEDYLNFQFHEEYNDNTLTYNIYDDTNNLISLPALLVKYGDNRYSLDVSTLATTGFFIMEIINDKKEKRFLRFTREQ